MPRASGRDYRRGARVGAIDHGRDRVRENGDYARDQPSLPILS